MPDVVKNSFGVTKSDINVLLRFEKSIVLISYSDLKRSNHNQTFYSDSNQSDFNDIECKLPVRYVYRIVSGCRMGLLRYVEYHRLLIRSKRSGTGVFNPCECHHAIYRDGTRHDSTWHRKH